MSVEDPEHLPEEDVVYCFMNDARMCSAACAAYVTHPEELKGTTRAQQHCAVLHSLIKGSRGAHLLSAVAGNWFRNVQTKIASTPQSLDTFFRPKG